MTQNRPITFAATAALTPLVVACGGGDGAALSPGGALVRGAPDAEWTLRSVPGRAKMAPENRITFGLYMAALDEEEQAAESYAGLVRRADEMPWSEDPPLASLGRPASGVGRP
jgi:hypothetical protein